MREMRGNRGRDQEPHDPWGKRAHARSRKSQRGHERLRVQRGRSAVPEPAPNETVEKPSRVLNCAVGVFDRAQKILQRSEMVHQLVATLRCGACRKRWERSWPQTSAPM